MHVLLNGSLVAEAEGCGQVAGYVAEAEGCGQVAGYVAEAEGCGYLKVMLLKLTEHFLYNVWQHTFAPFRRNGTRFAKDANQGPASSEGMPNIIQELLLFCL